MLFFTITIGAVTRKGCRRNQKAQRGLVPSSGIGPRVRDTTSRILRTQSRREQTSRTAKGRVGVSWCFHVRPAEIGPPTAGRNATGCESSRQVAPSSLPTGSIEALTRRESSDLTTNWMRVTNRGRSEGIAGGSRLAACKRRVLRTGSVAQVEVPREWERCSGRRSRQAGEQSPCLHGKAVVTRSVLRLVTGANADDERADAGYAIRRDVANGPAPAPAEGPSRPAIPQRQCDAPPGMVSPAGWGPRERLQRGCTRSSREGAWPVATRWW